MLVEFRVTNFKSIKDECVLSMVANKDTTYQDTHTIESGIKSLPRITRSAAMYGPNGSGKSNILSALAYMRGVVIESATQRQPGQTFNVQPFRLDQSLANQPTSFEITYIQDGIRYQYGFSMTQERITEEWLLVYKFAKPQQWFNRYYDSEKDMDVFELGANLAGARKYWQESTRSNSLFLSTAVQLNSDSLRPIFNWITDNLVIFGAGALPNEEHTIQYLQNDDKKNEIYNFLTSADIRVSEIGLKSQRRMQQTFHFNPSSGEQEVTSKEHDAIVPVFHHKTDLGTASFGLQEESLGTQRLFALVGPVLEILRDGKILVIDELDSSLHALLARKLIDLFHSSETSSNGAQLIFSTHDTSLLDIEIFRRDQIWFVEKNIYEATKLYPLTEFSPRKNEALERGYLMGRYGAVPFFNGLQHFDNVN